MSETDDFVLDDEQVRHAQGIIDGAKVGRFTLRQLFGKKRWDALGGHGEKRDYGTRFHNSYIARRFDNAIESGKKSGSIAYEISRKTFR